MSMIDKKAIVVAVIAVTLIFNATPWAQQPTAVAQNVSMPDQIHSFWSWFANNESRFNNLEQDREHFVPEIVEHLRQLSQNLTIEVEAPKNGVRIMAISADGVEGDFPLVEQLVSTAPSIKGWRIVAFRQPGKIEGMELNFPDLTLDTGKMWIRPIDDIHGFDLIIFFSRLYRR